MKSLNNHMLLLATIIILIAPLYISCAPKTPKDMAQTDASTLKPKSKAYYHFTVSRHHFINRRFAQSLRELELAEKYDPESAYLKYNLALIYISQGEVEKALSKLERSIELNPGFSPSYTLLGKVYAASENPEEKKKSVKIFKKAIELSPDDAESLLFLGIIQTESNDFESAEESFKKIIELHPDNEQGYYFLARLYYDSGNMTEAEKYYKEALAINDNFPSALLELALVYEKQGRIQESDHIYTNVIEIYPYSLEAYVRYGNFLYRVNRKQEAKEQFEKAKDLDYHNPDLKLRLGLLYIEN